MSESHVVARHTKPTSRFENTTKFANRGGYTKPITQKLISCTYIVITILILSRENTTSCE